MLLRGWNHIKQGELAMNKTISYLDVHEYAGEVSGQDNETKLQSCITFRLENFSRMTIEATRQLDHWIDSLKFTTSRDYELRHAH